MRIKKRLVPEALTFVALLLAGPAVSSAQATGGVELSAPVLQIARLIGVEPLLARLSFLSAAGRPSAKVVSLEELSLHQEIAEAAMVASLDVDSVVNQIDNERAQIVELQNILLARQQRSIGTTNLATLALSTGLGAISGVLQFSDTTKGAGNMVGFAAGGLSTLLSFRSLRQQHSEGRPAWVLPNMLAPFFSNPQDRSDYPTDIWTYLTVAPAAQPSQPSTAEQLVAQRRAANRFPPLDSPESKPKIARLTSTDAADKKLTMDLLSERAAMLADVRAQVSAMKPILAELLRGIRLSR